MTLPDSELPSYNSLYKDLTDEVVSTRMLRENVNSGEIHASLIWNDIADLDLHVITPSGEHIYYGNKESTCGGWLDVDMNASNPYVLDPIENIFWASSPNGKYKFYVRNFNNRTDSNTVFTNSSRKIPFRVKLTRNNETKWFDGVVGANEEVTCFEFTQQHGSGAVGSFIILPEQNTKLTFEEHCSKNNVTYVKGSGFYCLKKKETISAQKDLILYNKTNDTFIIGRNDVLAHLGLANVIHNLKPSDIDVNYTLYVQSTSHNRQIPVNTKVLIKAPMREVLKFRRSERYTNL
jgi:hypothetical protein